MTHRTLALLAALNLALLGILAIAVTFSPRPAQAQFGNADYTMIAGEVTGRNGQEVVWVMDASTGRTLTLFFNVNTNAFTVLGGRNVASDIQQAQGD